MRVALREWIEPNDFEKLRNAGLTLGCWQLRMPNAMLSATVRCGNNA